MTKLIYNKEKTEEFINRAREIHGTKYDYSEACWTAWHKKITVICFDHGPFYPTPDRHINKRSNCASCSMVKRMAPVVKKCADNFVERSNNIHTNIYTYNQTVYKNATDNVTVTCQHHGDFEISPHEHLKGHGCIQCGILKSAKSQTHTQEEFIARARDVHGNRYSYINVDYKLNSEKVAIDCKTHGTFFQTPTSHTSGSGCPRCKTSKGENLIACLLSDNNIKFTTQKTFPDLTGTAKRKRALPYDFYLPEYNILIEFDGAHHFAPVRFNGKTLDVAKIAFVKTVAHDKIKNKYAIDNNIELYRIPHYENIEQKLSEIITLLYLGT